MPTARLAYPLWWLADRSLALVFYLLTQLPEGWLPLGKTAMTASVVVWLLLIAFRLGWWRRTPLALLVACCLPLLWQITRKEPEWRLDMLDIGHGGSGGFAQRTRSTLRYRQPLARRQRRPTNGTATAGLAWTDCR